MMRATVGDILESRGSMSMTNNTFNIETSVNEISIFSYRSEITGSFLQSSALNFICPRGYTAKPVYRYAKQFLKLYGTFPRSASTWTHMWNIIILASFGFERFTQHFLLFYLLLRIENKMLFEKHLHQL